MKSLNYKTLSNGDCNGTTRLFNGGGYNSPLEPKRTSFNVEKLKSSGLEQKIIGC